MTLALLGPLRLLGLAALLAASPVEPPVEPPPIGDIAGASVSGLGDAALRPDAGAEPGDEAAPSSLDLGGGVAIDAPLTTGDPALDEESLLDDDEPDANAAPEPNPLLDTPQPIQVVPVAEPPPPPAERPLLVVKTLLGLLALVVLAYLGGHPRVRWLEAKLGISRVIAAGFPFLLLGFIAASDAVGVLSPSVIDHMRPVLHLALGWLGLAVGMRVELGRMSRLPRGTPAILAIGTGLPFLLIAVGGGLLLLGDRAADGNVAFDRALVRDALVLGAAGAMAADTDALRIAVRRMGEVARDHLQLVARLDETVGLIGLIFLTAYVRPESSWNVPGTAWLFITLGLPACAGFVVYLGLRLRTTSTELVALLLGFVAFVAGIASTLLLSALVVCFVVGVLLANFPGDYHDRLRDVLGRLEAPIYLLFLLVAGARWQPGAIVGWALVLVLVAARLPGRWLGVRLAWRRADIELPPEARPALVLSPLGTLPIAIAVNVELLYPDDPTLPAVVTAVIGATILLEFFAQLYWRTPPETPTEAPR